MVEDEVTDENVEAREEIRMVHFSTSEVQLENKQELDHEHEEKQDVSQSNCNSKPMKRKHSPSPSGSKRSKRRRESTESDSDNEKSDINCACNYIANHQCSLSSKQVTKDNYEDLIKFFMQFQRELDKQTQQLHKAQNHSVSAPELEKNLKMFGSNFYKPSRTKRQKGDLRPIFIDGSNVAFGHGQNKFFSVKGLQICIDFFKNRGHEVKAFVPNFRLKKHQCSDPLELQRMVNKKLVITTPTLMIRNRRRIPYDDWYIVQAAAVEGGIIVSRDNFVDILKLNPSLRKVVEEYRLVPTWVDDMIIFPVDPLGNRKNNLDEFLKF